jgi:hypothetical protein
MRQVKVVDADGFELQVDASREKAGGYAVGDDVTVRVDPKNARLIAEWVARSLPGRSRQTARRRAG